MSTVPTPPASVLPWWAHAEDEPAPKVVTAETVKAPPPLPRESAEQRRRRIEAAASGEKFIHEDPAFGEALNIFEAVTPPPFDGSEFPPELARYPLINAAQTGFDPTIMLVSALGVATAAITDKMQITNYYGGDWFQQSRLFLLLLGLSGASKSPAYKLALKPLVDIQTVALKEWHRECARIDALPKDEQLETEKPKRPVIVVNDTTIEALAKALANNDRGVLITTDEFTSLVGSMDAYKSGGAGGKDRAEYLRLYDGGYHSVERAKEGGSVQISNWGASIVACTTPDALRKIAKLLYNDGFTQRFNVVYVNPQRIVHASEITPEARSQLVQARMRYTELIKGLYALEVGEHGGVCVLSAEALELFDRWRSSNKLDQDAYEGTHPGLASHFNKGPNFLLRVMLIFHCIETVSFGGTDPTKRPIGVDTFALAATYLDKAYRQRKSVLHGRPCHLAGLGTGPPHRPLYPRQGHAATHYTARPIAQRPKLQGRRSTPRASSALVGRTRMDNARRCRLSQRRCDHMGD